MTIKRAAATQETGAQRSAAQSLALLEVLTAKAPVGFGFVDREFRIVRTNEILAAIEGSTADEQIGKTVAELVPELWPQLEPLYRNVLETGQAVRDVEVDGPSPTDAGRTHHWLNNLYPVVVGGEVIGVGVVVVDITERSDAEDARRQLARIVEDSGDAIFGVTTDGTVTSWNSAAESLFGYTEAEMLGRSVAVLAPPDLLDEQEQMRDRMQAGGATERHEARRRGKDGHDIDVLLTVSPLTDRRGGIVGVSVIAHDITTRRAAQNELLASQRRLAEAQQISELGSFELDLVTGELTWSAEHYRIMGLDPSLTPTPELFVPLVHPEDRARLAHAWQQATERGVGFDLHYRIIRPDSEQRWVHNLAVPDIAADGAVVRLAGTLRDETDWVQAARVREEAEARFETSFEQAGIGAAILDLDGVATRVNTAVCSILGRRRHELVDHNWDEYQHPDNVPIADSLLTRVAAGHDSYGHDRCFIRPDGSTVWTSLHLTLVRDESGTPLYCLSQLQDITERKLLQDELSDRALYDSQTGLANAALLTDRLSHALAVTNERGARLGVIYLDIDRLKTVNDSVGHAVADDIICRLAERLSAAIRGTDTVARIAGDEFVIVCDDASPQETTQTAERVLTALRQPYRVNGRELEVTVSAGIALADEKSTPESLLRDSQDAMFVAKSLGRDRVAQFDKALQARVDERHDITTALRHALDRQELEVHYQPIVDLTTGVMVGAEALLRWNHPGRGMIAPDEFIPIAEETGLIIPIGAWVLEQACQHLSEWQQIDPSMTVAVNLSVCQVLMPDIVAQVADVLARTAIPPHSLCLELTESLFMQEIDYSERTLAGFKELGVQLSLDDFGTGYSSLSYLSRFPFDEVKIDRAFIRGLGVNDHDTALVVAILSMAQALELSVTAEGIEDGHQLVTLQNMNCQRAQGFHIGRPMAADALAALVARRSEGLLEPSRSSRADLARRTRAPESIEIEQPTDQVNRRGLGRLRSPVKHDTIAVLGLDHVERVNKSHGHSAGEPLRLAFARILRGRLRSTDMVSRLSGEKLLVIFPDTTTHAALIALEEIRLTWNTQRPMPVTFSAGIAQIDDLDLDAAMRRASAALDVAKAHGHDRFEIAGAASDPITAALFEVDSPETR